ncbi:hypothetical protein V5799_033837 [Amblyomma americanum]|uniref:Uncharacterized protein n=1 Tax=Amblyomma americanum TaxID=6943 RepID=A0AAQ4DM58_AMBAM
MPPSGLGLRRLRDGCTRALDLDVLGSCRQRRYAFNNDVSEICEGCGRCSGVQRAAAVAASVCGKPQRRWFAFFFFSLADNCGQCLMYRECRL